MLRKRGTMKLITARKAKYVKVFSLRKTLEECPLSHAERERRESVANDLWSQLQRTPPEFGDIAKDAELGFEAISEVYGEPLIKPFFLGGDELWRGR